MILFIILAMVCAAVLVTLAHPIMRGTRARQGWVMLGGGAMLAIGIYLAIGSPDAEMAPALFETAGPRHDEREASQRELILLEALAGAPDNVGLLTELGIVRIEGHHPQDAIEALDRARSLAPHDAKIRASLGAAHYELALIYAMQPRKEAQALAKSETVLAIKFASRSAPYYPDLAGLAQRFGVKTLDPE